MPERKILQIMPAPGWGAVFDEDGDEFIANLVGWALVEDGEGQSVVGLVAREKVELCDQQPRFAGYVHLQDMWFDDDDDADFEDDFDDEDEDDQDGGLEDDGPPYDPKGGLLN